MIVSPQPNWKRGYVPRKKWRMGSGRWWAVFTTGLLSGLHWIICANICFYHRESLMLMTRVLLQQPFFHNVLLVLAFTLRNADLLEVLPLNTVSTTSMLFSHTAVPAQTLISPSPNLQRGYHLFSESFSELFLPPCSCFHNILCIRISLHFPGSMCDYLFAICALHWQKEVSFLSPVSTHSQPYATCF